VAIKLLVIQKLHGNRAADVSVSSLYQLEIGLAILRRCLDADPRIREIVLGKIPQDDAIAQQLNLPLRADIQRARDFIVEGGFRRLFAELDKGTLLPAVGIPFISLGLASRDNETR
jgi:hypothetical protein